MEIIDFFNFPKDQTYNKDQVRKLISAIQKGKRFKPEFGHLVQFHIMKAISELNKKEGVADY